MWLFLDVISHLGYADPFYVLMKNNPVTKNVADNCWYAPCASDSASFVPPSAKKGKCSEQVCKAIIDVINAGGVTVSDTSVHTLCDIPPPINPITLKTPKTFIHFVETNAITVWVTICIILVALSHE